MPIKTTTFTDMEPRVAVKKSRVFRRSRGGCRNCKLRKIKVSLIPSHGSNIPPNSSSVIKPSLSVDAVYHLASYVTMV